MNPDKVKRFRSLPRSTLARQREQMPAKRMAEAAGVSVELVRQVLREHGIRGKHTMAKLTEYKVRQIRQRHKSGWTQTKLAAHYGVDYSTINRIVNGLEWKWVK
jgi:transcriptional regulator with XRE-family HTH domain